MASEAWKAVKRFILWDFSRGSWQYDVLVGLILVFIFFTPRQVFRDQPRPVSIAQIPSENAATVYWLEPSLLNRVPESERLARAAELLKSRLSKKHAVVRVEPIFDSEEEIHGYLAFARP